MSLTLTTVALSGVLTWAIFHRFPIEADHAAAAYVPLAVAAYAAVHLTVDAPLVFFLSNTAIYVISALLTTALYRLSPWHKLASFPGPLLWRISTLPLVYHSYTGRRYLVVDELHEQYGDFVRIGPDSLSVKRKSANTIIYGSASNLEKTDSYLVPFPADRVKALFFKQPRGSGVHAQRRRVWTPAFSAKSILNFLPPMEKRTWELLHCVERRQAESSDGFFDVPGAMVHWAYDLTCDMLFGGCVGMALMKNGDHTGMIESGKYAIVLLDSLGQAPWLVQLARHLPVSRSQLRLRDECGDLMEKRVRMDGQESLADITSYFLADNENRPSVKEMRLDSLVAIQAGSDNVSMTSSIAFFYLLTTENGRQLAALRKELDATFPDPLDRLDWETLAALPYLNGVVSETLRLGSPFYLPRLVGTEGLAIDERFIPEGTHLGLAAYSLQVCPTNFSPAPLEFRAERWLPDAAQRGYTTDRNVLYAFGAGPHNCLGKALAYQELRYVLARFVLAFDMELVPGFDAQAFRDGIRNSRTTVFDKPLRMRVKRRDGVVLPDAQSI